MALDKFVFRVGTSMLLFACLFALGCSRNVKVSGTVTYSDTGDPVMFGTVFFASETEMGQAIITEGKYSVGLINDGDGIPPGTYTIYSNSAYIPPRPAISIVGMDGNPVQISKASDTQDREVYYTAEPETIEIKKSMTYNFKVERGSRPNM
jgi:hypothetical protein